MTIIKEYNTGTAQWEPVAVGQQGNTGFTGSRGYTGSAGVATPGGSDSYVQYNNGGALGGESDFVYDDVNNHVGIGTTSPAEKLHVNGSGETALVTPISYGTNQDSAYLIASASNYDGTSTNWGTKGFSHRIKSDGSGIPSMTIETPLNGQALAILGNNAHTVITKTLELSEDYTETISSSTGSTTINLSNGTIFLVTTNGNNTVTLPTASAGKSFIVGIGYGGTHTITWAGGSTLNWPGGSAPSLTSTTGRIDFFSFFQTATETYGIPVAFDVY